MRSPVLIVGAGPTGLVLALWLTKQGVDVRIIDAAPGPGTTSRAVVVQARTLELYQQLGLAEAVLAEGHRVEAANVWVGGSRAVHLELGAIGAGMTPYPFIHVYPQDRHERLLVDRLAALGVSVERRTELVSFIDHGDHVAARLQGEGGETVAEAQFLVGCDGASSPVRKQLGIGFPGGTYRQLFYVADIEGRGEALNGELHVDLDEADFVAVFPLADSGRARLIGTVRDERADHPESLSFDDVSQAAISGMGITVDTVNWFSTYRVHHRVADRFRKGRAFIAGDAGHIHSPAGGQGMNTGIGDAINLAWKLAAVIKGTAPDTLLDTYTAERAPFARRLVRTTDRAFSFATAEGNLARIVRTRLVPAVLPLAVRLPAARGFMFRTISQTTVNYRGSAIASGRAGRVHGGDRLPYVRLATGDNYAFLADIAWQVHVYGTAGAVLRAWCEGRGIALHVFDWSADCEGAGIARDAAYLLRPDSYVAVAEEGGDPAGFDRFLDGLQAGEAASLPRA